MAAGRGLSAGAWASRLRRSGAAIGLIGLAGCPSNGDAARSSDGRPGSGAPASAVNTCTRVGQTCEVSKNKLGSCVQRDDCAQDCLVCQSQH
jgi:hypothetical protein